jgi:hypothetical protein
MWGSGGIAPPFLILVLDGGEWSASGPDYFTLGQKGLPYPFYMYRKLSGPRSQSWRRRV